jgi:cytidine deaminase
MLKEAYFLRSVRDLKRLPLRNYKIASISLTNRGKTIILGQNIEKSALFAIN